MMVLECTELVAPGKLAWHSVDGFNCDRQQDEFHRCWTCRAVREYHLMDWERCQGVLMRRCECWKLPIPLFLVSRKMHTMATEVFYSKNIFEVITTLQCSDYWIEDGSFLLRYLPPSALRSLRKIAVRVSGALLDENGDGDVEDILEDEIFKFMRK